jgi:hypothetical protein
MYEKDFKDLIKIKHKKKCMKDNFEIIKDEFFMYNKRCDLLVVNNKDIIIYEIKSNRDNLEGIKEQIEAYYEISPYINLVFGDKIIDKYFKEIHDNSYNNDFIQYEHKLGIYIERNKKLHCLQKAKKHMDFLNKELMFKIIRKSEHKQIFKTFPEHTDFNYYSKMSNIFCSYNINKCYRLLRQVLLNREKED